MGSGLSVSVCFGCRLEGPKVDTGGMGFRQI